MSSKINKLNVGSETLLRYADLDYDMWYALAEFVDNSLHSFVANKQSLNKQGTDRCNVNLSIEGSSLSDEIIKIHDNAGGIHEKDFERLLSIGRPKERTKTQLSEFGMGMKTAGFWLGRLIEIETKHFLSKDCFKIVIDIDKLGTPEEVVITKVSQSSQLQGYTKICIRKLNRRVGRKKRKITDSLSSIYRKYIEDGIMEIKFDGEYLKPLHIELLKSTDNTVVKKDFTIELANGKKANGWIGILKQGKTILSGFSIYRYNRLIQGYPENSWRPKEVFGQEGGSNTIKNQRLIGEIDMSEFKVAHTKNKVNFVGEEEEEFRKLLGEECKEIARESSRTNKSKNVTEHEQKTNTKIVQGAVDEFFSDRSNTDTSTIDFITPVIKSKSPEKVKEIVEKNRCFNDLSHLEEGIGKAVKVYHFQDVNLPYMILDTVDDILCVCINIDHPYYIQKDETSESMTEYMVTCIFDALTEEFNFSKYGKYSPEDARLTKDIFMKKWIAAVV